MRSWPELLAGWRAVRGGYERREFEAWGTEMMRCGGAGDNEAAARFVRHRTGPLLGEYVDAKVEARWQAWKARAFLHANSSAALAAAVVSLHCIEAYSHARQSNDWMADLVDAGWDHKENPTKFLHRQRRDALEALRALLDEELPRDK